MVFPSSRYFPHPAASATPAMMRTGKERSLPALSSHERHMRLHPVSLATDRVELMMDWVDLMPDE